MPNPRILIVEDDRAEQRVLEELLRKFDYEADIVSSGEEAIDKLRASTYAAVIMDITLPGMSGYDCTRRIRELDKRLGRHTSIVALTARAETVDKRNCFDCGMDDYMCKPFNPEELRKMLLRWVYLPAHPNLKVLPGSVVDVRP